MDSGEEKYISAGEEKVKEIPLKSGFGFWNIIQYLRYGYVFIRNNAIDLKTTVYKMRFPRDTIVVTDFQAVSVLHDHTKIEKKEGFANLLFNEEILKNVTPSIFENGYEHEIKKDALLQYDAFCLKKMNFDSVFNNMLEEFEKLPKIEKDAKGYDIEENLEDLMAVVISKVMVGTPLDPDLLRDWAKQTLKLSGIPFYNNLSGKAASLADELFSAVKESPYMKEFKNIMETPLDDDTLLAIIVWMLGFNGHGAMKLFFTSYLCIYNRLSESDKKVINKEADEFLKSNEKSFHKLHEMHYINQFFLEAHRLNQPAGTIFGEALHDFILESKSGFYQIKKGDSFIGSRWCAHRDEELFENPYEFSLNRDEELYNKYVKSYGGSLNKNATLKDHKCTSQLISTLLLKLALVFITKCDVQPHTPFIYTGLNAVKPRANDGPVKVSKFIFTGIKN